MEKKKEIEGSRGQKQEKASVLMEWVMNYGWAILVIVAALLVLYYFYHAPAVVQQLNNTSMP